MLIDSDALNDAQSETQEQEVNLYIKTGLFYSDKQQLTISNDFIQYQHSGGLDSFTRLLKDEIAGYRYGIKWIRGYKFYIGRNYKIFIRNTENRVIQIDFLSLYGIKKKEFNKLYVDILDAIWKMQFQRIAKNFLDKFNSGQSIEILKVIISREGIYIPVSNLFKEQLKVIPWEKVGTSNYRTYFNIHSKEDKAGVHKNFNYLEDWNTAVLYYVVRTILLEKKLLLS